MHKIKDGAAFWVVLRRCSGNRRLSFAQQSSLHRVRGEVSKKRGKKRGLASSAESVRHDKQLTYNERERYSG